MATSENNIPKEQPFTCDNLDQFYADINKEYERLREEQRRRNEEALMAQEQEESEDDDEGANTSLQQDFNKENIQNNIQNKTKSNTNEETKNTNEIKKIAELKEIDKPNKKLAGLEQHFKNQCFVSSLKQNSAKSEIPIKNSVLFGQASLKGPTMSSIGNNYKIVETKFDLLKKPRSLSDEKQKKTEYLRRNLALDKQNDSLKAEGIFSITKESKNLTYAKKPTESSSEVKDQSLGLQVEKIRSSIEITDKEKDPANVKAEGTNNQTYPFMTPCRIPPKNGAQSLPTKSRLNINSTIDTNTPKPRILCTVDMRSHLNTPIFQPQAKPSKATTKKRLLSTSNLISVPEDEDGDDDMRPIQPLCEKRVKDVFKCIKVNDIEYIVLNELGKGGSSVVYHCYDPDAHEECAVKVVDLQQDSLGYINEVKALQRLQDCDRIIKLLQYQAVREEKKLYMVLEKGGRDFAQILREHSRNAAHLPAFMVHFYWMQMLHAVRQMHDKGVIHSDLKPANFIEIRERLKLIDFGIASCVQLDMTSVVKTVALGTFGYISPEALCTDQGTDRQAYKIGFRSDVWSLGCILYQLVYKRTPFAHIQHSSARLSAIMDPNHVIEYPPADWVPSGVVQCIRACLQYNARRRPTIDDLIKAENTMITTLS